MAIVNTGQSFAEGESHSKHGGWSRDVAETGALVIIMEWDFRCGLRPCKLQPPHKHKGSFSLVAYGCGSGERIKADDAETSSPRVGSFLSLRDSKPSLRKMGFPISPCVCSPKPG